MSLRGLLPTIQPCDLTMLNCSIMRCVGSGIFFQHNFDGIEIGLQAGALHLGGLLGRLALGQQDQPVVLGQVGERFRNTVEDMRRSASSSRPCRLDFLHDFAPC